MILQEVESSNIAAIGYDEDVRSLYVKFKHGQTYQYFGVTKDTHTEIMAAESIGKAFHKLIKLASPPYEFRKLEAAA